MKFNPEIHHRRSIRLKGFDYSRNGIYFVTICSWNRECLFGELSERANGIPQIILNPYGDIVHNEWIRIPSIRKEIGLGEFIIMPNHFHAIVFIHGRGDRPVAPTDGVPGLNPKSVGSLMAGYKSAVTKNINILRNAPGVPVWQRNYYERIIRNESELKRISDYIVSNPANWIDDENNPFNFGKEEKLP